MTVLFVGPLPPPVHGFSAINAAMLASLQVKSPVSVFNRAHNAPGASGGPIRWWLRLVARFAAEARGGQTIYMGFSGGKGQLLDLPILAIARWHGCPVYLHHHSFAYLSKRSLLTALCFRIAGQVHHIALGGAMEKALQHQYAIAPQLITVLSNAAFLSEVHDGPSDVREPHAPNAAAAAPVIGYLSNITAEKGIFDFLNALRHLHQAGLRFRGLIAGPVDPEIKHRFEEYLAATPNTQHVGPVYGTEKAAFYQSLDVLVFPTRYVNEAEPVTLHEALQAGTTVIAAERGCIRGMVPAGCGEIVGIDAIPATLEAQVRAMTSEDCAVRLVRRQRIAAAFRDIRSQHRLTLERLTEQITA